MRWGIRGIKGFVFNRCRQSGRVVAAQKASYVTSGRGVTKCTSAADFHICLFLFFWEGRRGLSNFCLKSLLIEKHKKPRTWAAAVKQRAAEVTGGLVFLSSFLSFSSEDSGKYQSVEQERERERGDEMGGKGPTGATDTLGHRQLQAPSSAV